MNNNTSFSIYNHIAKEPLLTREEEVILSKRIEKGDQSARDRMIRANLRLAVSVVKKYSNRGIDADDLLQESLVGLTKAVDQFDWSKGFRFSTYAYWWIQQAVRQCVTDNIGPIVLPTNTFSKLFKISKFEKEYALKFGKPPTDEETAEMFGTTTETLRSLRVSATRPASFDTPLFSDDSCSRTLKDVLPSYEKGPEELIDDARLAQTIQEAMATLTPRERRIIELRFGLNNEEDVNGDA